MVDRKISHTWAHWMQCCSMDANSGEWITTQNWNRFLSGWFQLKILLKNLFSVHQTSAQERLTSPAPNARSKMPALVVRANWFLKCSSLKFKTTPLVERLFSAREFSHMFNLKCRYRPGLGSLNQRQRERLLSAALPVKIGWHKSHDSTHFRLKVSLSRRTPCWHIFFSFGDFKCSIGNTCGDGFTWRSIMWRNKRRRKRRDFAKHYSQQERKKKKVRTRRDSLIVAQLHWISNRPRSLAKIQIEHIWWCGIMCHRGAEGGEAFSIINGEPWRKDIRTEIAETRKLICSNSN